MYRVLVVDDLKDVRDLLSEILDTLGYETQTANDGREALAKLESDPFDIVISDVEMPIMDGLSLLESVKQRSPALPVVLIAGHKSPVTLYKAAHCKADGFLQKPFRIAQFSEMVEKALNRSKEAPIGNTEPNKAGGLMVAHRHSGGIALKTPPVTESI